MKTKKVKPIKTIKGLAKELCRLEEKKKQVDIAQMSEVLSNLSDIVYERLINASILFYDNGLKRAQKRAKSCKK